MNSKNKNAITGILFICCLSLILFSLACNSNPPTSVQNGNANTPATTRSPQEVVTTHGTAPSPPKTGGGMGSSGTPIDTSKYDADIKQAEAKYEKNKEDAAAKTALAQAYLARANALTLEGRQYNAALGDYRRTLKYDPANEEAKKWIGQIVEIYQSLGREVPKEGEENKPLPYEKK